MRVRIQEQSESPVQVSGELWQPSYLANQIPTTSTLCRGLSLDMIALDPTCSVSYSARSPINTPMSTRAEDILPIGFLFPTGPRAVGCCREDSIQAHPCPLGNLNIVSQVYRNGKRKEKKKLAPPFCVTNLCSHGHLTSERVCAKDLEKYESFFLTCENKTTPDTKNATETPRDIFTIVLMHACLESRAHAVQTNGDQISCGRSRLFQRPANPLHHIVILDSSILLPEVVHAESRPACLKPDRSVGFWIKACGVAAPRRRKQILTCTPWSTFAYPVYDMSQAH